MEATLSTQVRETSGVPTLLAGFLLSLSSYAPLFGIFVIQNLDRPLVSGGFALVVAVGGCDGSWTRRLEKELEWAKVTKERENSESHHRWH